MEILVPRGGYFRPEHRLAKRDAAATLRFFRKAIRHHDAPELVTIDKSGANMAALTSFNADESEEEAIALRQSKYLNNLMNWITEIANVRYA